MLYFMLYFPSRTLPIHLSHCIRFQIPSRRSDRKCWVNIYGWTRGWEDKDWTSELPSHLGLMMLNPREERNIEKLYNILCPLFSWGIPWWLNWYRICLHACRGSVSGLGRSPGEGNGYPLQYTCLENSMDKGAWQTTVHVVAKGWTQLNHYHFSLSLLFPWVIWQYLRDADKTASNHLGYEVKHRF